MRKKILFRGFEKCVKGKEKIFYNNKWIKGNWIYGYYNEYSSLGTGIPAVETLELTHPVIPDTVAEIAAQIVSKSDTVIFFEDDIVKSSTDNRIGYIDLFSSIHVVVYPDSNDFEIFDPGKLRVIGNRWSNPELLDI